MLDGAEAKNNRAGHRTVIFPDASGLVLVYQRITGSGDGRGGIGDDIAHREHIEPIGFESGIGVEAVAVGRVNRSNAVVIQLYLRR